MAKKPKRKERDGPTQSQRFIEAARKSGADESGKEFERAIKSIIPARLSSGARTTKDAARRKKADSDDD